MLSGKQIIGLSSAAAAIIMIDCVATFNAMGNVEDQPGAFIHHSAIEVVDTTTDTPIPGEPESTSFFPLPPQPQGACILPDGSCQVMPGTFCRLLGGTFQGPGTTCD